MLREEEERHKRERENKVLLEHVTSLVSSGKV